MSSTKNLENEQKYLLRDSINQLLSQHNWNLKTLSERSAVPYETVKKIANAKIDKPSLYNVTKIADAFECSLDTLVGHRTLSAKVNQATSSNFLGLIESLCSFQQNFMSSLLHPRQGLLPIICPNSSNIDGMPFSEASFYYHDFSSYRSRFGDHLLFGLQVTNSSLLPLYPQNTFLLIGDEPPANQQTIGIYLQCNHLYIRIYQTGSPARLKPTNKKGAVIFVENPSRWHSFGYILTKIPSPI